MLSHTTNFRQSALVWACAATLSVFSLAANAAETPIGKPHVEGGMEVAAVYLQPIEMDLSAVSATDRATYFSNYESGKFHSAAGIGLKIGWNENFIISADYGKAFNKQDGNSGMYIGLNYLF